MNTQTKHKYEAGFKADFKAPAEKRKIRFASKEEVEKVGEKVHGEFGPVFKLLADR